MSRETPFIVKQLKQEEHRGILQQSKKKSSSNTNICNLSNNISTDKQTILPFINFAEKSNTAILITDKKGTIEYINKKFEEITSFSLKDYHKKNVKTIQCKKQISLFNQLCNTISSGIIWSGEVEGKRSDEEVFYMQVTIIPIYNQNAKITHVIMSGKEFEKHKNIELSLKIKENALLSSINAIILTDLSGNIKYVNPSFLRMWSYDSEKTVIGKTVFSLWKKGGQYAKIMDTVIQEGGWLGEVIARSHNGRLFPVQMSASIVKDDEDKPLQIMASFVDITKQKRLEKNYKKFKKISDEADYGSVIYDLKGTILYGNKSFAQMHDYDLKELIGKNMAVLYQKEKRNDLKELFSKINKQGKIIGMEQWHCTKQGTSFPLLITSKIINDGQFHRPFISETMIDISEMKQAEKQIIRQTEEVKNKNHELNSAREKLTILNENLEEKVAERTEEVQKLIKLKDEFINQLGHDLKTPLTPMNTLLPLVQKMNDNPQINEMISVCIDKVRFMKELVKNTLELAQMNSPNFNIQLFDIHLLAEIERIVHSGSFDFEEQDINIDINIPEDIIVKADTMRFEELINNLVSNAVKYSPDGGNIHIKAELTDDDMVQILIQDSGMGMTKDQQEHVFDEFYKADESRHDFKSTGLGLPICKRIIDQHGGSIWAESKGLGNGCSIYFTLKKGKNFKKNDLEKYHK